MQSVAHFSSNYYNTCITCTANGIDNILLLRYSRKLEAKYCKYV